MRLENFKRVSSGLETIPSFIEAGKMEKLALKLKGSEYMMIWSYLIYSVYNWSL